MVTRVDHLLGVTQYVFIFYVPIEFMLISIDRDGAALSALVNANDAIFASFE